VVGESRPCKLPVHLWKAVAESEKGFVGGGGSSDGANGISHSEDTSQDNHFPKRGFDGETREDGAQWRQLVVFIQGVHFS